LLLGAGASAHLGFPLGNDLRDEILKELRSLKNSPETDLPEPIRSDAPLIEEFHDKMFYGNWWSPDAFLEHHPKFLNLGKYLICKQLARCENMHGQGGRWGWYEHLVDAIHSDTSSNLKHNKLSIVTFNYDRTIDFRLHMYVTHRFGHSKDDAWRIVQSAIPIVHVHGTLGDYPRWPLQDTTSLFERSRDIKIISEAQDSSPEFQRASELLNAADRVVVIGFGFAPRNVDRLQFFGSSVLSGGREIIVVAGGMGANALSLFLQRTANVGLPAQAIQPRTIEHLLEAAPSPFR
jgi:hypothetical protein